MKPIRNARQTKRVVEVIRSLDARGAWVEAGKLRYQDAPSVTQVIRCSTFASNVTLLSEYMGRPVAEQ